MPVATDRADTFSLSPRSRELIGELTRCREAGRLLDLELDLLRPGMLGQWVVACSLGLTPSSRMHGHDACDDDGRPYEVKTALPGRGAVFYSVDHNRRSLEDGGYQRVAGVEAYLFATATADYEVQQVVSVPGTVVADRLRDVAASHAKDRIMWLPRLREVLELGDVVEDRRPLPGPLVEARRAIASAQALAGAWTPSVSNVLLKGRAKEMVLADLLGHTLNASPQLEDAVDAAGQPVEYLCSATPGARADFVMTHLRQDNLYRVTRNTGGFFCATWHSDFTPAEVWHLEAADVLAYIERTVMPFRANRQNQMHLRGADAATLGRLVYQS